MSGRKGKGALRVSNTIGDTATAPPHSIVWHSESHTFPPPRCRKTKKSANCNIFRQYGRFFLFTFYLPSGDLLFPFRFKYFTHEELLHLFSESIKQAKQCVSEIVLKSCNGVWLFFGSIHMTQTALAPIGERKGQSI